MAEWDAESWINRARVIGHYLAKKELEMYEAERARKSSDKKGKKGADPRDEGSEIYRHRTGMLQDRLRRLRKTE